MHGSVVTSQYPGNDLQREAEKNSASWPPEKPPRVCDAHTAPVAGWFAELTAGRSSANKVISSGDAGSWFPRGDGEPRAPRTSGTRLLRFYK